MTCPGPRGLAPGRWLYERLLRLFPSSYRAQHGPELEAFFEEAYTDAYRRRGWWGAVVYTLRAMFDVIGVVLTVRRHARPHPKPRLRFSSVGQDLRYAVRSIGKTPLVAGVSVITIALGVGANTAIFSIVNAVMLTPLPFTEPERLVTVWEANTARDMERMSPSYPNFRELAGTSALVHRHGGRVLVEPVAAGRRGW